MDWLRNECEGNRDGFPHLREVRKFHFGQAITTGKGRKMLNSKTCLFICLLWECKVCGANNYSEPNFLVKGQSFIASFYVQLLGIIFKLFHRVTYT